MLYHLSTNDSLSFMTPRIPESAVPEYEDTQTPRVCVATSINGCLNALEVRVPGDVFDDQCIGTNCALTNTVTLSIAQKMNMSADDISFENVKYLIDHPNATVASLPFPMYYIYIPDIDKTNTAKIVEKAKVFDQSITGEYWITKTVKMICIGKLIVFSCDRLPDVRKKLANGKYDNIRCYQYNYHFVSLDHELPHQKLLKIFADKEKEKNYGIGI